MKGVNEQFANDTIVFNDENVDMRRNWHGTVAMIGLHKLRGVEQERVRVARTMERCGGPCGSGHFFRRLSSMNVEITTRKIGSKWHGFIEGRPDIDETALTEEAAREKVRSVRARLGACGARTKLFGGLTCELVKGHVAPVGQRLQHRRDTKVWSDVTLEDGADAIEPESGR